MRRKEPAGSKEGSFLRLERDRAAQQLMQSLARWAYVGD